jgi:hypothetical protein
MKSNKSQDLYLLLSKYDRNSELNIEISQESGDNYPYFYLLNWNFQFNEFVQRKIALQSPFRSQYYFSICDAPLNNQVNVFREYKDALGQEEIINEFLSNQPSITRLKKSNDEITITADLSNAPFSPPISETFAMILIKQGKISLAIDIYHKLILSKPEKRLYFATRISELSKILTQE